MFGKTRMQFLVVVSMFFMASCDSIYEDLPRCELWLEFTFDHNMEYADAFDPQVNSVDVFVFGDDDKLLLTKRAEPTALVGGNRMSLADETFFWKLQNTYRGQFVR
ncbi:FimB/Mfa2 family fimbrial subunit [Bacteroides salyersiae]|nr:FimB/Mfa2 family fimbrial subunit [Bacteroides salyersiae]